MNIKIGKKEKYEPKHVQAAPAEPKPELRVHPTPHAAAPAAETPVTRPAAPAAEAAAPTPITVPVHAVPAATPPVPEHEHVEVHARPNRARYIYDYVLNYVKDAHSQNQRRIHTGMALLYLLPLLIILIVALTGSNRIVFLIIWIVAMFALAIFMIFVAFDDHQLKKVLHELEEHVPDSWTDELDGLLPVSEEDGLAMRVTPEMLRQWLAQRLEGGDAPDDTEGDGEEVAVRVPRSLLVRLQRRAERETADEQHLAHHQN